MEKEPGREQELNRLSFFYNAVRSVLQTGQVWCFWTCSDFLSSLSYRLFSFFFQSSLGNGLAEKRAKLTNRKRVTQPMTPPEGPIICVGVGVRGPTVSGRTCDLSQDHPTA
jgi:hypothetical protein